MQTQNIEKELDNFNGDIEENNKDLAVQAAPQFQEWEISANEHEVSGALCGCRCIA